MHRQPCTINGIEFDALLNENKNYTSEVPAYAVETGYEVSDNISIKPKTVDITVYLTNTPVTWIHHGTGRVESNVSELENLYFSRTLVTLTTRTNVYKNMSIRTFSIIKDETNYTSREIKMSLQEVTVVSSQSTSIPGDYGRGGDTGANAGTASTGKGSTKPANENGNSNGNMSERPSGNAESTSEKKSSILYNLFH